MRIGDRHFITVDKTQGTKKAEARSVAQGATGAVQGSDSVSLSAGSRDIAEIALQLKEASEVREELVTELREKIANGEYSINGKNIAAIILKKAETNDIF